MKRIHKRSLSETGLTLANDDNDEKTTFQSIHVNTKHSLNRHPEHRTFVGMLMMAEMTYLNPHLHNHGPLIPMLAIRPNVGSPN